MLIFGTKAKTTWTGSDTATIPCDACGQSALLPLVIQRYVHVFWLPFVPLGKQVFFECSHCKRTVGVPQGPAGLEAPALAAKAAARTPIHFFAGLALLALLLGGGALKAQADARQAKVWIAQPAVGDLYVLDASAVFPKAKGEAFKYVVAHVDAVTPEGVEVRLGTFGYALTSAARKAIRHGDVRDAGYLGDEKVTLSGSQLKAWLDDHSLTDVVR